MEGSVTKEDEQEQKSKQDYIVSPDITLA